MGADRGEGSHGGLVIAPEAFDAPDAARLAADANRELRGRYGPFGAPHPLPTDFVAPAGVFLVARLGDRAVACGGIRSLEPGIAEIRRMYTVPEERGKGVAGALLRELERWARRFGYRAMRLETGWLQPDAIAVYERAGYRVITCYGEFDDASSICMEKVLRPAR